MVMDPSFSEFSDSTNGFIFNDQTFVPNFDQHPIVSNGYKFKDESLDLSFLDLPYFPLEPDPNTFAPSMGPVSDVDSPDEYSDTVYKFLNQILLEENMESKPSMFHDPLALQATEESLYEALGEKFPSLPYQMPNVESPDENFLVSSSEYSSNSNTSACNSNDTQWVGDSLEFKSSTVETHPVDYPSQKSVGSTNSYGHDFNGQVDSFMNSHLVPNIYSDSESISQFKKGLEEASKFLPPSNPIVIDLDKYDLPSDSHDGLQEVTIVKVEKDERDNSPNGSRGRKHYHTEDIDKEEERSSKQSAVFEDEEEEEELSEMFDRVLLCTDSNGRPVSNCEGPTLPPKENGLQQNGKAQRSNGGGKARSKRLDNKTETVDLRTLLVNCAQSVATDDRRTAEEQLKQIRQHASISGDASQRLAHIFAAGLEARLAGTGSQLYAAQSLKRISAAEKLKAYQVYLSACPFKKVSIFFANKMILGAASTASTVHIVDFGIQYGFQWPIIIQRLSERAGGPPKLRITGIELPQPGFRPAERVEETGRRLANYCKRFGVPFEYNAIATQTWESIKIEDLKIERDEFLAVNCLFRFKNLHDETVVVDNPRDAVLKLIRRMKPDIFINAVVNGSYSAPFFVTRFREALFHYSSLFDMFDATLDRDSEHRLNFEKEFCGREAMNVIACEGAQRVERPETYKQWQVRKARAGFKPLPLDKELIQQMRNKVQAYHKDFVFDENGKWILQGWKGRILYASSCWVPV